MANRTWISKGWDFDVENITWANDQTIYFTCAYLGTAQIFKTNISENRVDKVTEGVHDMGPLNLKSGVLVSGLVSMSMAPEISVVDMTTVRLNRSALSINLSMNQLRWVRLRRDISKQKIIKIFRCG